VDIPQREVRAGVRLLRSYVHSMDQTARRPALG